MKNNIWMRRQNVGNRNEKGKRPAEKPALLIILTSRGSIPTLFDSQSYQMIGTTISHYKILEKVQVVARHEFLKKGD